MESELQQAFKTDVRLLGDLLGHTIRRLAGESAYALEEEVRLAAKALRASHSVEEARRLRDRLHELDLPALRLLTRCFSIFFDLINLAEQQARVRALRHRARQTYPAPPAESPEAALVKLRERGVSAEEVEKHLNRALVAAVFTAHPSEARRRTVLEKLTAIGGQLDRLGRPDLSPPERDEAIAAVTEEVEVLWLTDTVRAERPSVLDEVCNGLGVVEDSLFGVVPRVYRDVESALRKVYPEREWSVPSFLRFGSWIGGDRDGNPNVTHGVTADAIRLQQEVVLGHYLRQMRELGRKLSHSDRVVRLPEDFRSASAAASVATREPFRDRCRAIAAGLERTLDFLSRFRPRWDDPGSPRPEGLYLSRETLRNDLEGLAEGLRACGSTAAAAGSVQDLLRQVDVFGVHLVTLDIRQHSRRHASALHEVFERTGVCPNYLALPPAERFNLLATELESTRPLIPTHLSYSPETVEVIQTFRTVQAVLEGQCPEAVENYIISFTTEPSDLLEVLLLAREARLFRPEEGVSRLQIVPLFESLDPLRSARGIMEKLFALPAYRSHLLLRRNEQEIMIGYSDSNKESGPLQSAWALYRAQCELSRLGRQTGVSIRFFHGRGGAVGRGGGPANRAILAQPRGTVDDRLRITEQGEMIADRYGHPAIAERHLGQVINAVLLASLPHEKDSPEPAWEAVLDRLAESAYRHYRELMYETPELLTYFEQATPIGEISQLKIGSRPARRGATTKGIDELRAIPWVFSWMQSRHTLPGWYGLGSALGAYAAEPGGLDTLREMYRRWPFWSTLLDNAQMILAKADMTIARLYADLVGDQHVAGRIYGRIAAEYDRTVEIICRITGQNTLLEQMPVLQRSIQQRNPYVDPLSFIQLVLLKRLRGGESDDHEALLTGVLESINGVAAGLKNTG